ncbi:MAG TPA: Hpt domain-containing protein [Magnetospirillum sp.]|nr:Hpt domain-containing protein [Magnetospirillum sp.]
MAGDDDLDVDPDALARAEAALAALSGDYLTWARADVSALEASLSSLRQTDPARRPEVLARSFAIAHDIKGQAATFGYPLLTRLGNAVCRLIDGGSAADAAQIGRLELLTAAMSEVVAGGLAGDGGERGRALAALLDEGGNGGA